jgi:acyl carrier protein
MTMQTSDEARQLKQEIKEMILETLNITDVDINQIDDEKPLFGSDNALTLDSVDGIEIIMAIQRKYGVRLNDQNLARHIIQSINTIAEFIQSEKAKG